MSLDSEEQPVAVLRFSICSSLFCNGKVRALFLCLCGVLTKEREHLLKHGLNALSWRGLRDLPSLLVLPSSGGLEEQPCVCVTCETCCSCEPWFDFILCLLHNPPGLNFYKNRKAKGKKDLEGTRGQTGTCARSMQLRDCIKWYTYTYSY